MGALSPSTPRLHLSLLIAVAVVVQNWPYVLGTMMEESAAQEMVCWLAFFECLDEWSRVAGEDASSYDVKCSVT